MLTGARRSCRAGSRPDGGFTIVELGVAMVVTAVLLAAVATALTSVVGAYRKVQDTTLADDRGRVILDRIDRDLRQASAVNLPQTVGGAAFVEYQTDVGDPAAPPSCTQWRLDGSAHLLAVRTWTLPAPAIAPGWATVATGVVNDLTAEPPFTLAAPGATAQREQLAVQLRLALPKGQALTKATVAARNSSASTGAAADADGDGVPDAPVCLTFGRS
jgi:Tfp pilus assembly protein PilW